MADSLLHYLSTTEKFLLFSTKFWSSLSTVAGAGAVLSFYSTEEYTNHFTDSGKYICTVVIAFHFILFLFDPNKLKHTFSLFFFGSAMKWALRATAMRVAYVLLIVPEQSVVGLIFVICVWIDILAIARFIRPSIDHWLINSVFMAIVSRSVDLYGFTARYWLVMLFCFPMIFMQIRLEGYKNEETVDKEG